MVIFDFIYICYEKNKSLLYHLPLRCSVLMGVSLIVSSIGGKRLARAKNMCFGFSFCLGLKSAKKNQSYLHFLN